MAGGIVLGGFVDRNKQMFKPVTLACFAVTLSALGLLGFAEGYVCVWVCGCVGVGVGVGVGVHTSTCVCIYMCNVYNISMCVCACVRVCVCACVHVCVCV